MLFPRDQIFCPLFADPKEPRSFVSYLRGTFRALDDPSGEGADIGAVGIGDNGGGVRLFRREPDSAAANVLHGGVELRSGR